MAVGKDIFEKEIDVKMRTTRKTGFCALFSECWRVG